jgi:hypothetical protein
VIKIVDCLRLWEKLGIVGRLSKPLYSRIVTVEHRSCIHPMKNWTYGDLIGPKERRHARVQNGNRSKIDNAQSVFISLR